MEDATEERLDAEALDRRRPTARAGALAALVTLLAACTAPSPSTLPSAASPSPFDTTGRAAASWSLAPGEELTPKTRSILIGVRWMACASGAAVEDPQPVVTYEEDRVTLAVYGIVPEGPDFLCQGTEISALEVPLTEPLGNRPLVPGAKPATVWPT